MSAGDNGCDRIEWWAAYCPRDTIRRMNRPGVIADLRRLEADRGKGERLAIHSDTWNDGVVVVDSPRERHDALRVVHDDLSAYPALRAALAAPRINDEIGGAS